MHLASFLEQLGCLPSPWLQQSKLQSMYDFTFIDKCVQLLYATFSKTWHLDMSQICLSWQLKSGIYLLSNINAMFCMICQWVTDSEWPL